MELIFDSYRKVGGVTVGNRAIRTGIPIYQPYHTQRGPTGNMDYSGSSAELYESVAGESNFTWASLSETRILPLPTGPG